MDARSLSFVCFSVYCVGLALTRFKADLDDYNVIMVKALADRLAEVSRGSLHCHGHHHDLCFSLTPCVFVQSGHGKISCSSERQNLLKKKKRKNFILEG